jgi:hypothetical protein
MFDLADHLYQSLEEMEGGLARIAGSEQEFALRSKFNGLRVRFEQLHAWLDNRTDD